MVIPILDLGKLGKVNMITMNFGSFKEYGMNNRFFNRNLAGGAMLDIGVYTLSFFLLQYNLFKWRYHNIIGENMILKRLK